MARKILTSTKTPGKGNLNYYQLPKGMLSLTLNKVRKGADESFSVDIVEKTMPDPSQRYYLIYHANAFVEDIIKINFTAEGYLESIDTTSEGKTLAIVDKAIETVAAAASASFTRSAALVQIIPIFEETFDPFDESARARINQKLTNFKTGFELSIQPLTEPAVQDVGQGPDPEEVFGIFCRPIEPFEVILRKGGQELRQIVNLPHPDIIHVVEIPHAPFVTNKFTMTFESGYPRAIELHKPSQALAMMEIPLKILKAIVEIPAQLFRFRIDYNNNRKDVMASDQDFNESKLAFQERETEFRKALAASNAAKEEAEKKLKEAEDSNDHLKSLLKE